MKQTLLVIGVAAATTLAVLAIANRVEIPGINPRMTSPRAPASTGGTSGGQSTQTGGAT